MGKLKARALFGLGAAVMAGLTAFTVNMWWGPASELSPWVAGVLAAGALLGLTDGVISLWKLTRERAD